MRLRLTAWTSLRGFRRHKSKITSSGAEDAMAEWTARNFGSFKRSQLMIEKRREMSEKPPDWDHLIFGHHFSDHMLEVEYEDKKGWARPHISPLHDLALHPAAKVFHYAIELFEGMKAYRGVDNKIRIFRPDLNMKRMIRTAARACLPTFNGEELIACIEELVRVDSDWVPQSTTSSLYIRPTFIGTSGHLGVASSPDALLYVVVGPVGPFFPTGFRPVALYADPTCTRAWHGGAGAFKMGSNYAPTILIGKIALDHGCQQVLWLHGEDQQLTEVGTMNIFIYWENEHGETELVTPPLDEGLILPGITRQSLLELAREWNEFKVSERVITMGEVQKALQEKRLKEMFGSGTACIVCPVEKILHKVDGHEEWMYIPTMEHNPSVMQKFFDAITDIQYGRVARAGWMHEVKMNNIMS